jgi:hypothetical protein
MAARTSVAVTNRTTHPANELLASVGQAGRHLLGELLRITLWQSPPEVGGRLKNWDHSSKVAVAEQRVKGPFRAKVVAKQWRTVAEARHPGKILNATTR